MLPDTPQLQAEALAAQYKFGDLVEISCKPIDPVWEEATSRYQSLQVATMRLERRPAFDEVMKTLEARARGGKNLLRRPPYLVPEPDHAVDAAAPGMKEWERARKINLEYVANMPNFVADETAKRERSAGKTGAWHHYDTVQSEITFRGRQVVRQQIRRNGKHWDQPFDALPGYKWYEGFESEINPLFDTKCPTTVEYQGTSKAASRQLLEYRFHSPVDGCFPFFYFEYARFNPTRKGTVLIDSASGSVMEVDDQTDGFPADFEFAEREEHVYWDYVKIGDSSHLLPVRASFLVLYSSGTRYRVEVEYRNHRHFETSSNVSFQ
jgi:hypothetical protein